MKIEHHEGYTKIESPLVTALVERRIGWVRLGRKGWGIKWKDITVHPLLFSERNGYRKGIEVKGWGIFILQPYKMIGRLEGKGG